MGKGRLPLLYCVGPTQNMSTFGTVLLDTCVDWKKDLFRGPGTRMCCLVSWQSGIELWLCPCETDQCWIVRLCFKSAVLRSKCTD